MDLFLTNLIAFIIILTENTRMLTSKLAWYLKLMTNMRKKKSGNISNGMGSGWNNNNTDITVTIPILTSSRLHTFVIWRK